MIDNILKYQSMEYVYLIVGFILIELIVLLLDVIEVMEQINFGILLRFSSLVSKRSAYQQSIFAS